MKMHIFNVCYTLTSKKNEANKAKLILSLSFQCNFCIPLTFGLDIFFLNAIIMKIKEKLLLNLQRHK